MTTFLSSYVNAVDKKGRVSVPAAFRAELAAHSRQTIVVFAAPDDSCLFAWGYDDFLNFAERIKKLPALSKERQRLSRTLLAASVPLPIDGDGRIMLPPQMCAHAHLVEKALFAGQGEYFTIWSPEKFGTTQNADLPFYDADIAALSGEGEVG